MKKKAIALMLAAAMTMTALAGPLTGMPLWKISQELSTAAYKSDFSTVSYTKNTAS